MGADRERTSRRRRTNHNPWAPFWFVAVTLYVTAKSRSKLQPLTMSSGQLISSRHHRGMKITNHAEANRFLQRQYRNGWNTGGF